MTMYQGIDLTSSKKIAVGKEAVSYLKDASTSEPGRVVIKTEIHVGANTFQVSDDISTVVAALNA